MPLVAKQRDYYDWCKGDSVMTDRKTDFHVHKRFDVSGAYHLISSYLTLQFSTSSDPEETLLRCLPCGNK